MYGNRVLKSCITINENEFQINEHELKILPKLLNNPSGGMLKGPRRGPGTNKLSWALCPGPVPAPILGPGLGPGAL